MKTIIAMMGAVFMLCSCKESPQASSETATNIIVKDTGWSISDIREVLGSNKDVELTDIQWIELVSDTELEVTLVSERRVMSGWVQLVRMSYREGVGLKIIHVENADR